VLEDAGTVVVGPGKAAPLTVTPAGAPLQPLATPTTSALAMAMRQAFVTEP
jgi:hypothetical protein